MMKQKLQLTKSMGFDLFTRAKNRGLIFFFFLFLSVSSYGQLATESFESGIPSSWSLFQNSFGTTSWSISNDGYLGGKAATIDPAAENIGAGKTADYYLVTPSVSVPANGEIRFYTKQGNSTNNGTVYQLRVSTASQPDIDGFSVVLQTWTEDDLYTVSPTEYEEKVVVIPPSIPVGLNIYLAFVAVNNQVGSTPSGDSWFVDDVRIIETCPAISNFDVTFTNTTLNSVDVNWANPSATDFEIQLVPAGDLPSSNGTPVSALTYSFTSLLPGKSYDVYIKSICNSSFSSIWAGPFNFKTLKLGDSCINPIVIPDLSTPYVTTDNLNNYSSNSVFLSTPGASCTTLTSNYASGGKPFYSFTATTTGVLKITMTPTEPASYSGLFVYEGCANVGVACAGGVANDQDAPRIINLEVTAGTNYIILVSSNYDPSASVPYTLKVEQSNCPVPFDVDASSILPTSAKISWANIGSYASSWEYVVQAEGTGVPSGSGIAATSNSNIAITTTIDNAPLVAGTKYEIYVRANCGSGFTAWSDGYLFTTQCNVFSTPYFEDFNTGTSDTPVPCWYSIDTNKDGKLWSYRLEGEPSIATGESNGNNNDLFVSPQINLSGVGKRIRFKYRTSGEGSVFSVVLSTTGVGKDDFTTVLLPVNVYDTRFEYIEKIINIPETITGNVNIAFYVSPDTRETAFRLNIDDVYIEDKPACSDPLALTAAAITTTTAELSWEKGDVETQWDVAVQPLGTGLPSGNGVLANSNPFTVTDLISATRYEYYVRAHCSSTLNSNWVGPFNFTTLCASFDSPFTESFNDVDINTKKFCWTINNVNGDDAKWQMNEEYPSIQSAGFFFPTSSYDDWLISPPINVTGSKALKFKYRSAASFFGGKPRFGVEVLISTTDTDPASFTVLAPLFEFNNISFLEKTLYFTANSPVYIAFRVPPEFSVAGGTTILQIDDVVIEDIPACPNPTDLSVKNITQSSASLSWLKAYQEDKWDVVIQPAGGEIPTGSGIQVNTTSYVPNNLVPNTEYEVYVRASCGSSTSEWIGPIAFRTLCTSFTTPFKETFDTSSVSEDCWRIVNNNNDGKTTWNLNVTVRPIEGNQMSGIFSGNNGENDDWMISPTITIKANQRLRYSYRVKDSFFTEDLKVKLSTNGIELDQFATTLYENSVYTTTTNTGVTEGSPIVSVATLQGVKIGDLVETPGFQNGTPIIAIDASNLTITLAASAFATWEAGQKIGFTSEVINNMAVKEKIINFPSGVTGDVNVAFQIPFYPSTQFYKGQLLFIDNFIVEDIPACAPPSNITTKDIVDTGVKIGWDVNGTETDWEISVQPFGTSAPVGNTLPEYLFAANKNPFTVTGLTPATKYQYYVRSVCGASVQSEWVGPFVFNTKCSFENLCEYTISLSNDNSFGVGGGIDVIQNGTKVQTLEFPTGPWGEIPAPIDYTLFLCSGVEYSLFWDSIGTAPDQYPGAQIIIKNALGEVVWTGPLGLGKPRTTLYTGVPICGPITCPQPTNVAVSDKSVFNWTAGGTEIQWEVYVQPLGNGTLPQSGIIVDSPSYTPQDSDFNSQSTSTYEYFVRAICNAADKSFWSGPKVFVRNDDSSKAILLQVNPNEECNVSASNVTFVGSTPSAEPMSCSGNSGPGVNGGDIWFEFKATSKIHIIEANGFTGNFYKDSGDEPYPNMIMTLYQVESDGSLKETACSTNNVIVAMYSSELIIGQNYKVRLTLNSLIPSTRLFNVCVKTPSDLCLVNAANYDFEHPPMQDVTGVTTISTQYVVPGWRVNVNTWEEIFFSEALNSINFVPYSGGQCIQLLSDPEEDWNASDPNIKGLYKEFDTSEITVMDYSFAHATRSDGNVIQLYAGPPQGPFVLVREEPAVGLGWSFVTGNYNVPLGQNVTRFIFRTKENKIGTLLDAANFMANNKIKTLPTTLSCSQTSIELDAEGVGVWSADDKNPSVTTISNPNSKSSTITGFTEAGEYTFYWKTRYCENSVVITYQKINEVPAVVTPVSYCVNQTATPVSATAPVGYTLLWYTQPSGGSGSTNAPTPDTSIEATTVYYVSLVDEQGCQGPRVAITVEVKALPIASISGTTTICSGATASITFNGTPNAIATYIIGNGANQTVTLVDGKATVTTPVLNGNTTYNLVSVASSPSCSQNQTGAAIITVTPSTTPNVVFSYDATCVNEGGSPLPVLSNNFATGGIFSSSNLTVNATNGAINLINASAGTYQVVYTLGANNTSCVAGATFSADVILKSAITPVTSFSYNAGYCTNAVNALPVKSSGFSQGGTFSSTTGLVINGATGEINVAASTPGSYVIKYEVLADAASCNTGGDSSFTTVISRATDFSVEKTCTDQELVLEVKLSTEGVNYIWKNGSTPIVGSTNATFNIDDYLAENQSLSLPLNISASVTKDGCNVEKSFVIENNTCKLIPRGISPNADESNDTFDLTGYGVRELIIYNRYGAKVFNFKGNYTNQWKGQSDDNDELPDGTYFYSIQYSSGDPQTGWVYINRQN